MGLCCGCPFLVVAVFGLVSVWRRGGKKGKSLALAGAGALVGLVGLAAFGIGRYVVLEEGVVLDACDGDSAGVERRLKMGGSANAKTDEGLGALGCAATNGHVEAALVLLEHGADPDASPDYANDPFWSKTPRQWAVAGKNSAMIRLFARYPDRRKAR